jgi:hypothetical protein
MKPLERLPPFSERGWALARTLWWVLLGLCATVAIAGSVLGVRDRLQHGAALDRLGLVFSVYNERLYVRTEPARRAGVVDGSELLAVDGRSLPSSAHWADVAGRLHRPDGSIVELTLRTPTGEIRKARITADPANVHAARALGMTPLSRSLVGQAFKIAISLQWLLAAALLFHRRGRYPLTWILSVGFILAAPAYGAGPPALNRLGLATPGVFILIEALNSALFLLVLFTFPDGRFAPRWTQRWGPALVVAGLGLAFLSYFLAVHWMIFVYYALLFGCLSAQLSRFRATAPGVARQQLKWSVLGWVAGAVLLLAGNLGRRSPGALGLDALDPTTAGVEFASARLFDLGMIVLPLGMLVALLRFKLWDADRAIGRSAAVAGLTVALGAVFAGSQELIKAVLESALGGEAGAVSAGIAAAVTAATAAPVARRLNSWAERRFERQLHALRTELPRALETLRDVASTSELMATAATRVGEGVRAVRVAAVAFSPGGPVVSAVRCTTPEAVAAWLDETASLGQPILLRAPEDPLFPVRLALDCERGGEPQRRGWLLLGPRPDGSLYNREELDALKAAASLIGPALAAVQAREARETAWDLRITRVEALLAEVVQREGAAGASSRLARAKS